MIQRYKVTTGAEPLLGLTSHVTHQRMLTPPIHPIILMVPLRICLSHTHFYNNGPYLQPKISLSFHPQQPFSASKLLLYIIFSSEPPRIFFFSAPMRVKSDICWVVNQYKKRLRNLLVWLRLSSKYLNRNQLYCITYPTSTNWWSLLNQFGSLFGPY